jgi:hypothetical protein
MEITVKVIKNKFSSNQHLTSDQLHFFNHNGGGATTTIANARYADR